MSSAANILLKQYKELTKNPLPGFVVELPDENIFKWSVAIIGAPRTIYEGGYFKATMTFPEQYPFLPPTFRFNNKFFHPNVYEDGRLCISILHPPGDDPVSGEKAEERWNPTQSVESILVSIISLLADPNCSSPANVDAGVAYRKNRENYDAVVKQQSIESRKDIPKDYKMPQTEEDFMLKTKQEEIPDDENFWNDDSEGSDFDEEDDDDDSDDHEH